MTPLFSSSFLYDFILLLLNQSRSQTSLPQIYLHKFSCFIHCRSFILYTSIRYFPDTTYDLSDIKFFCICLWSQGQFGQSFNSFVFTRKLWLIHFWLLHTITNEKTIKQNSQVLENNIWGTYNNMSNVWGNKLYFFFYENCLNRNNKSKILLYIRDLHKIF